METGEQKEEEQKEEEQKEREQKEREEKQALFTLDRCFGYVKDRILRKMGGDVTSKNIAQYLKEEQCLKLYLWQTEFEVFTYENLPLDPQTYLDIMYADPIISEISGRGLNRIASWLSLFDEFVEVKRCDDRIFLCNSSSEYENLEENTENLEGNEEENTESAEENDNICKLSKEGKWEKIKLLDLLQKEPLSYIYVHDGSDCDDWVNFVEIAENDDYSI